MRSCGGGRDRRASLPRPVLRPSAPLPPQAAAGARLVRRARRLRCGALVAAVRVGGAGEGGGGGPAGGASLDPSTTCPGRVPQAEDEERLAAGLAAEAAQEEKEAAKMEKKQMLEEKKAMREEQKVRDARSKGRPQHALLTSYLSTRC